MQHTPPGWPRVSPSLYYQDPRQAIDWLCDTFGFEVRLKVEGEGGRIEHSELTFGDDGLIMVGGVGGDPSAAHPEAVHRQSPRMLGGANTQNLMLYVDDVEAHCERARKAGAKILMAPETHDYGEEYWADRIYEVEDLEGHHWWFSQRMRTLKG